MALLLFQSGALGLQEDGSQCFLAHLDAHRPEFACQKKKTVRSSSSLKMPYSLQVPSKFGVYAAPVLLATRFPAFVCVCVCLCEKPRALRKLAVITPFPDSSRCHLEASRICYFRVGKCLMCRVFAAPLKSSPEQAMPLLTLTPKPQTKSKPQNPCSHVKLKSPISTESQNFQPGRKRQNSTDEAAASSSGRSFLGVHPPVV